MGGYTAHYIGPFNNLQGKTSQPAKRAEVSEYQRTPGGFCTLHYPESLSRPQQSFRAFSLNANLRAYRPLSGPKRSTPSHTRELATLSANLTTSGQEDVTMDSGDMEDVDMVDRGPSEDANMVDNDGDSAMAPWEEWLWQRIETRFPGIGDREEHEILAIREIIKTLIEAIFAM
ncbi:hypothetical protein B0T14DRAFT_570226 [Immersiella caudata]|uniref:Uncharacterized protein n=1 Tax=Immersiella caudata TaxID=314043 RepID=A0AA39WF57_9PEZI|nr:hypothetical protein B0T14DRAFT_570226 [Immersiella caudata]